MASKNDPKLEFVHPSELHLHHKNARLGDVESIIGSLKVNNQYKPILVNKGTFTGRPNEVLAGNHTLKAFRTLGERHPEDSRWEAIMVIFTDLDEDSATRILLADNETARKGAMDDQALYDLLTDLPDISGTGFDQEQLDELAEMARLFSGPAEGEGALDHDVTDSTDVTVDIGKVPKECAEAGLTVGVIRVKVPRTVYESWYDDLRESVGYEGKELQQEVLRRLGLA